MLPLTFKPKALFDLVRIGKSNDGGYLVCKKAAKQSEFLISFGISNDFSFEKHFVELNKVPVHAYDPSISLKFFIKHILINLIRLNLKNFMSEIINTLKFYNFFNNKDNSIYFVKIGVGGNRIWKNIRFEGIIKKTNFNKKIFIKIDIEGSEYRILDDIIKFEDHIKGIVIEFHQVDLNIERINDFIKKTNLKLIHIHPNNFANYGLNNIPTSLEISFSKEPEKISDNLEFPHPLDQKNNPNISDINLEFESEIYKC